MERIESRELQEIVQHMKKLKSFDIHVDAQFIINK